jgi:hypothetical protein
VKQQSIIHCDAGLHAQVNYDRITASVPVVSPQIVGVAVKD